MENTREIILDMLIEITAQKEYSHKVIGQVLEKYNYMNGQDKAFMKRVTEGTIERQIQIDYILNSFSSVKVNKMKPLIRNLLRMSVYGKHTGQCRVQRGSKAGSEEKVPQFKRICQRSAQKCGKK